MPSWQDWGSKMAEYRWASTHSWLHHKLFAMEYDGGWENNQSIENLWQLVMRLTGDDIQDLFESEMNDDGYFDEVEPNDPELEDL